MAQEQLKVSEVVTQRKGGKRKENLPRSQPSPRRTLFDMEKKGKIRALTYDVKKSGRKEKAWTETRYKTREEGFTEEASYTKNATEKVLTPERVREISKAGPPGEGKFLSRKTP